MVWSVEADGPWGNSHCVLPGAASTAPFYGGSWAPWGPGRCLWPVLYLLQLFSRPFAERQGFSSPCKIPQCKGGSYLIRLSQLCILRSQSQTASLPCKIFTIPFSCEQSQELISEHAPPVHIDGSCMNMEQSKIPKSCCSAESFLRGKSFCWRNCLVILSIFDTCTGSVRSSTTVLRKKIKSWVPKWRKRTDKLLAFYCYCCLKFPWRKMWKNNYHSKPVEQEVKRLRKKLHPLDTERT